MVTTFEDWLGWQGEYTHLPVVTGRPCRGLPERWLAWWRAGSCSALLETGKAGRFTILAPDIERLLIMRESALDLMRIDGKSWSLQERIDGPPLESLRSYVSRFRSPRVQPLPLTHGAIGFFSYDLVRLIERIPSRAEPDLEIPLGAWAIASRMFVFDHQEKQIFAVANREVPANADRRRLHEIFLGARAETDRMLDDWETRSRAAECDPPFRDGSAGHEPTAGRRRHSLSREEFMSAVRAVHEYIRSGDTYQVNLSIRESRPLSAAPEQVYEELRRINPSPYMGLLRLPDMTLVSGSPELLVRLRDGRIEARPIAGTRPRGRDALQDGDLARELIANDKERAEHLMLVDLIRNDLGRVSQYGTVHVSEFMTIEEYSHVMHIVSHIEGRPEPGRDLFDVIAATFPGGTITGAPKVRTMEIIEELEPVRRGPYTGSIGWIGFNGEMELNIAIRTLLAMKGEAHVQAGAGIVIDSCPDREYDEALSKGRALWAAIEAAEARLLPVTRAP